METALLRDAIPQDAQLRQQAGALPLPPHSAASPPSPALFRIAATWAVVHRPLRTVATPCSDSPAARISWMADGTRAACPPAFADHAALAGDRT
jgi:hypothetical protein